MLEPSIIVGVAEAVASSDVDPPIPLTVPPADEIAPVSEPFWIVPPVSVTLLIVCAKPPRSRIAPEFTVVALAALNAPATPPRSSPASTVVVPV